MSQAAVASLDLDVVGSGLAVWTRRPETRTGPLLAALLLGAGWATANCGRRAVAPVLWPGAISLVALGYYDTSAFLTDSVGPVPILVFADDSMLLCEGVAGGASAGVSARCCR